MTLSGPNTGRESSGAILFEVVLALALFVFAAVALLVRANVVSVPPGTPWAALMQKSLFRDLIIAWTGGAAN